MHDPAARLEPDLSSIEITGRAQKQAWDRQRLPPVERVGPGLWSLPVPIPNNPLRYVLVYALEVGDNLALVDAGWPTDDAWQALVEGLDEVGAAVNDVVGVLVTHIHPDHYGLAGRIREASGAWIAMHPADAAMIDERYQSPEGLIERMRRAMVAAGIPERDVPSLAEASLWISQIMRTGLPDHLIEDGDRIDLTGWDLRAVWTPGHSPGHLCFYEDGRKLLLSGDHVLPRISPNISAHPQQPVNPLADFLDSLMKVRSLDVDEVLPAHEWRFRGLGGRVDELLAHHEDRMAEIEYVLAKDPGCTCWELTVQLTWSRPWNEIPVYMRRAANGETLAHLVLLVERGRVKAEGDQPVRYITTS